MKKIRSWWQNKKIRWLTIGFVFLIIIGFAWKKKNGNSIAYRRVSVSRGELQTTILSTGIVQPENRLEIKPPISGRAEEVLVDEGNIVKKGDLLFWMSSTERAALLDAARARGTADLKRWEEFYKPTPVMAPIDGTIILRNIEPGQTFTSQDAVFVLSDRLTIQAQVDETDIAQIHLQQKAEILLDAYASEKIQAHVNKIAYDSKTVNNVTTYIVDVLPDKIPTFVRSGMTANVSFSVGFKENALILPSEAIKNKSGHTFVLLDSQRNGKDAEKEIKTGMSDGKRIEIISGLSEGDVVLVPQLKINGRASNNGSNPFSSYGSKPKQGR